MMLTASQFKELLEALLNAFPSKTDLELVMLDLGANLDVIARHGSFRDTAFEVITWADRHGRINELIDAAVNLSPGNAALLSLADRFRQPKDFSVRNRSEEWIDVGLLKQSEGTYEDALAAFSQAIKIARDERDLENEARALQLSGSLYRDRGQLESAASDFKSSLIAARASQNQDLVSAALRGLSSIHSQIGNTTEAIVFAEELYTHSLHANKNLDAARSLHDIARLHSLLGEFENARSALMEAVYLWRGLGDINGQALANSELATLLLREGKWAAAEDNFKVALKLARKARSRTSEAVALSNLGSLAFRQANHARAQNLFGEAIRIFEQLNDPAGLAGALANIGRIHEARREWDQALPYYRRSLLSAQRIQDRSGEATALTNIGRVLLEERNFDEASTVLSQALDILQSLGDSVGIMRTQDLLSLVRRQQAQDQQSLTVLIDDAQRFFQGAGFLLNTTGDLYSFICEPATPNWKNRITTPIYTVILVGEPLNGKCVLEVRREAYKSNARSRIAFILVDKPVEDNAWLQIAALRADAFQAIPVPLTLLYEGRAAAQPHWERTALSRHLTRFLGEGDDPYDVRDPVFDVLNFFGREALATSLIERLGEGKPIGLFGLRKMGKSSLMRFLQSRIPYPTAWLDLQSGVKLENVYNRILRAWGNDAQTRFDLELGLGKATVSLEDPSTDFLNQVQGVLALLADKQKETRLAIFLDEVELIMPAPNASGIVFDRHLSLLRTLRGLVQEDRRVSLMVAGIDPAINRTSRCGAEGVQNPFFKLLQEEYIPPLLSADCIQMVRNVGRQVELSFNDEAAAYIAEASGGHPSLARQLCSLAYRQRRRQPGEISYAQLKEAADQFLFDPQYASFLDENGLWGEITREQLWGTKAANINQEILIAIAECSDPVSQSLLSKGEDSARRRACLLALRQLWMICELRGEETTYTLTFGLFRAWIRQNRLGLEV
jgi:tetratricopeptide (TPR) repeat protein